MTNSTERDAPSSAEKPPYESTILNLIPRPPTPPDYCSAPPTPEEEKTEEDDEELASTTQSRLSASISSQLDASITSDVSTTYYGTDGSTTTATATDNQQEPTGPATTISKTSRKKETPELPLYDTQTSSTKVNNGGNVPVDNNDEEKDKEKDKGTLDDSEYYEEQKSKRRKERRFACYMFASGLVGVIIAVILLVLEMGNDSSSTGSATTEQPKGESTPLLLELLDLPPSTLEILRSNPQSPQGQAFAWLRQDPSGTTANYDQQRARQRFGLAVLYYATNGDEWHWDDVEAFGASFLSYDTHECDWYLHRQSFACNAEGHLISLGLHHMGLNGPIPKEVWTLLAPKTLTKVELGQNKITGTLGTYIGMLQKLTHLDISGNQMSGSLPNEIAACSSLELLVLNDNPGLKGRLTTELGLLQKLQGLWWMNTGVTGPIPSELGAMPSLQLLELGGNQLSGTIPAQLFSSSGPSISDYMSSTSRSSSNYTMPPNTSGSGLHEIRLARNLLEGSIPSEIVRVKSSLTKLDLSDNNFHSTTLPTFLAALTKLTSLQVRRNNWTGAIPSELGLLSTNLISLGLSESQLSGPVPSELLQLSQLRNLYLHYNPRLEGHIVGDSTETTPSPLHPFAVGQLTNLREFTINKTPLTGTLPSHLCDMHILSFTCDPQSLCGCDCDCPSAVPGVVVATGSPSASPTRRFVDLLPSYTRLAMRDFPLGPQALAMEWIRGDPSVREYSDFQIVQRFAMTTLYYSLYGQESMSHTRSWLSYETHECFWLSDQTSNVTCMLLNDSNSHTTPLHVAEGDRQVKGLILDSQGMQGSLPPEIALLSSLVSLRANNGDLTGALPTEIGILSDLKRMELQGNQFQGAIPSEFGSLTQLGVLDASRNKFTGIIPTWLGFMTGLRMLHLNDNSLRGSIPTEVGSMSLLEQLFLHDNDMISGRLPQALTSLSYLETLTVNKTFVAGRVPSSLCFLDHFNFSCSAWLCGCDSCACP